MSRDDSARCLAVRAPRLPGAHCHDNQASMVRPRRSCVPALLTLRPRARAAAARPRCSRCTCVPAPQPFAFL